MSQFENFITRLRNSAGPWYKHFNRSLPYSYHLHFILPTHDRYSAFLLPDRIPVTSATASVEALYGTLVDDASVVELRDEAAQFRAIGAINSSAWAFFAELSNAPMVVKRKTVNNNQILSVPRVQILLNDHPGPCIDDETNTYKIATGAITRWTIVPTTANFDITTDDELTIDDIEKPNDQEGLLENVRIFITEHHHRKLPFHSYKLHLFYAFQLAAVIASIHLTTYGKYEKMGDSDRKDLMARFEEEDALFGDKPNSHEIQRRLHKQHRFRSTLFPNVQHATSIRYNYISFYQQCDLVPLKNFSINMTISIT